MKDKSLMDSDMERVSISIKMVECMMVNGLKIKCKVFYNSKKV